MRGECFLQKNAGNMENNRGGKQKGKYKGEKSNLDFLAEICENL